VNAVIVMNGSTIVFTDDQGNVIDRYAVNRILIIEKNIRAPLAVSGGASGEISNNNEGGSADEEGL